MFCPLILSSDRFASLEPEISQYQLFPPYFVRTPRSVPCEKLFDISLYNALGSFSHSSLQTPLVSRKSHEDRDVHL